MVVVGCGARLGQLTSSNVTCSNIALTVQVIALCITCFFLSAGAAKHNMVFATSVDFSGTKLKSSSAVYCGSVCG